MRSCNCVMQYATMLRQKTQTHWKSLAHLCSDFLHLWKPSRLLPSATASYLPWAALAELAPKWAMWLLTKALTVTLIVLTKCGGLSAAVLIFMALSKGLLLLAYRRLVSGSDSLSAGSGSLSHGGGHSRDGRTGCICRPPLPHMHNRVRLQGDVVVQYILQQNSPTAEFNNCSLCKVRYSQEASKVT